MIEMQGFIASGEGGGGGGGEGGAFNRATHPILNVHFNTRSGKEMFHTSSMTSICSPV